jgi:tRNA-(ms[2]io[6]A)-hydroxylase
VARDEVEHLVAVTRLLRQRGGHMTKHHRNPYATALRRLVRLGQGTLDLMDRLMISALIEARSCERFCVLAEHCGDEELARLYRGLWSSEHGHYLVFIEMARLVQPAGVVHQRWDEMLESEAEIIAGQAPGPRMHGGVR